MTGTDRRVGERRGAKKEKVRHLGRCPDEVDTAVQRADIKRKGNESYEENEEVVEHLDGSDHDAGHGGSGVCGGNG